MFDKKRLFYAVAPLILLIAAVGCGGSKSSGSSANSTSTSGGATTSGSELASLLDNFSKVKSFKISLTIDSGSGTSQKGTIEIVTPDKMHLTVDAGGSLGTLESIQIGNDTYIKAGPSPWTKQSGSGGSLFDPKTITSQLASATDTTMTKGGTDTVNGKKCQIYNDTTASGSEEICIADGLPQRVISKGGGATTTIVFSDYNSNIDIKAPI